MTVDSFGIIQLPYGGMEVFTNRILNYRYHWHDDKYEVTTVLCGRAAYSKGGEALELGEDDVIIIEPLVGHASLALEKGTVTMTLFFDSSLVEAYASKGSMLSFDIWHSNPGDRYSHRFRLLRSIVADIMLGAQDDGPCAREVLSAYCSLLLPCLIRNFDPVEKPDNRRGGLGPQAAEAVVAFIEKRYMEKLSLEDLASFTGYNRTYLSSFFKTNTGLNFHEYLTRIRLKYSLSDLAYTDKPMTAIALDNGFPDLKTFANVFKANFHVTPSSYREMVKDVEKAGDIDSRILHDPRDAMVLDKLSGYAERGVPSSGCLPRLS